MSRYDMLNFHVVSVGHDMINDTDKSTTCRSNFIAPPLQREKTKNEGPSENMGFI